jgi:muconolactone delta-isomerase
MEYLVTMTTNVPDGTSEEAVADIRAREAAHTRELAAQGHILRLWRPPLAPGEWRTLGLFAAADRGELDQILASMPLRVWRSDQITELAKHPNDPDPAAQPQPAPRAGEAPAAEFLNTFLLAVPGGAPAQVVADAKAGERRRTHELAAEGHLIRLWLVADPPDGSRAVGLWRAGDAAQVRTFLDSLPMAPWLTEEITPLVPHPSDPAAPGSRPRLTGGLLGRRHLRIRHIQSAWRGQASRVSTTSGGPSARPGSVAAYRPR